MTSPSDRSAAHPPTRSTEPTRRSRASGENTNPNRPRTTRHRRADATPSPPLPLLVPPDARCQYKGKLCRNERTFKDDGERHTLCELHRQRANANQRRWQQKHQHKVRRRRAAAARANATAPAFREPSDSLVTPLLAIEEKEEDDWISPLFDHLIAKMETEVAAVGEIDAPLPRHHSDKPN